jgi:hypothetical protein
MGASRGAGGRACARAGNVRDLRDNVRDLLGVLCFCILVWVFFIALALGALDPVWILLPACVALIAIIRQDTR